MVRKNVLFDNFFTGQERVARLLIHNGADFTVKNEQGKTESDIATEKGITMEGIEVHKFSFIRNLILLKELLVFLKV